MLILSILERKNLSKKQKERIAKGQDWKCGRCQKQIEPFGFDIHHKDRDPSNNDVANLTALCTLCHRKVTQKENRKKDTKKNALDEAFGIGDTSQKGRKNALDEAFGIGDTSQKGRKNALDEAFGIGDD